MDAYATEHTPTTALRQCKYCSAPLRGRPDQEFCNSLHRAAWHRRENGDGALYMDIAELAKRLGVGEKAIRAKLRSGDMPCIRFGRRYVIPRSAVLEWLRTAGSKSERV